ncbi:hypothetical protein ACFQX6_66670 [Streptosporangium lutulentum]
MVDLETSRRNAAGRRSGLMLWLVGFGEGQRELYARGPKEALGCGSQSTTRTRGL